MKKVVDSKATTQVWSFTHFLQMETLCQFHSSLKSHSLVVSYPLYYLKFFWSCLGDVSQTLSHHVVNLTSLFNIALGTSTNNHRN
ncbi:Uncharacterised protein [Segatella copri]|nr:Uncharacterised protein [Segatella copri]